MPVSINGSGTIGGVSDFSSSNIALTDPEITGGIYLGGTGSANYLDDYEEGTWTPIFADAETGGNSANGTVSDYRKIGNIVTITFEIRDIDLSSFNSGSRIYVRNLPFARDSTTRTPQAIAHVRGMSFTNYVTAQIATSSPYINLLENGSSGFDPLPISQLTSNNFRIQCTIPYFTNA